MEDHWPLKEKTGSRMEDQEIQNQIKEAIFLFWIDSLNAHIYCLSTHKHYNLPWF